MDQLSEAQTRLLNQTAKRVREAIVKRAEMMQEPLAAFDKALEEGDEARITTAGVMLIVHCSSLMDPVAAVLKNYSELTQMLGETG